LFAEGWQAVPAKGDVPSARYGHSVVQINNLYYFFGGFTSVRGTPSADVYQYDATTQTFTKVNPTGQLPPGMGSHSAVAYNGKMFVVGGARATADNAMYVFDPAKKTWIKGADQPFGSRMSMAMAVQGSMAYLVGGCTTDGHQEPSGELWKVDLDRQSFTQGPSMPWGGRYAALGFADSSNLYVYGGRTGEGEMGDFWSFDPKVSAWSQLSFQNPGPNGRSNALCAYIGTTLFIQGGLAGSTGRGSVEMGDIWELDMSVNPPKWIAGPTNGPVHNQAAGFMSVTAGVAERAAGSLNISVFGGLKDDQPVPMDKVYQYKESDPEPPTTSVVSKIGVLGRGRFALYLAGFEEAQAKVTVHIQWTEDNAKLRLCALHIPWVIRDENPLSLIEDNPENFVGDDPQSLTPYIRMIQEQSKPELELEEVTRGQIIDKTFVNLKRGTLILLLQHCYGSKTARNVSFQLCSITKLPSRFLFLFPIGEPDTASTSNACIMDMVQFPVAPVRWYSRFPPGAVGKENTASGTGFWKWTYQDQTPRMHFLPGFVRFYLP